MPLEDLTGPSKYINALIVSNPVGTDTRREGDNHIGGVKNVIKNTFPNVAGAVSASHGDLSACENFEEAVVATLSPTLLRVQGRLRLDEVVYYDSAYANGDSGSSITIDWNNGNRQDVRLTDDCTFTFTNPPGSANLMLRVRQDGVGSRLATWPAQVLWPGGTAPTLSTGGNDIDIISFWFYSATVYYGIFSGDFD